MYAAHTPGVQLTTGRGVKRSPVHDRMVAAGAYLRDVSGWEGADWYAGPGQSPKATAGWGRQEWFTDWEREHRAVREAVGLMDMSFMAKFRVRGRDAGEVLDRISAGPVNQADGRITYTQWLAADGGIEADLTVTRLTPDDFLVVASDTAAGHVAGLLHRALGPADATVTDDTEAFGLLTVQGPRSREVLARCAPETDFGTAAFPYRAARVIRIGGSDLLAIRITYLGELGYELYPARRDAGAVWDRVLAEGMADGIRPVGLKALASLRLEKGYRDYGHDIDNTDDVVGVGLGFAVDLDKGDFVGRPAVAAARGAGVPRARLVHLLLDDPEPLLFHAEVVLRDGVAVGYVRAASYGWTLGGAVGLAFVTGPGPVDKTWLDSGTWAVDIAGRTVPARVSLRPFYDPGATRIHV